MPRSRRRPRSLKDTTRKQQPRPLWSSPAGSAGHRCPILKPSSSISRANIPRTPCLRSWKVLRLKGKPTALVPDPALLLSDQRLLTQSSPARSSLVHCLRMTAPASAKTSDQCITSICSLSFISISDVFHG
ncbi:hypothetical protein NFI96_026310 [Prochilodus magdalenae]|nr:hypothetical protein NFI96_026310 [Prochilodus magdalenae]